ncbi:hypothetical protein MtrunA17_Chr6g0482271 [Medicago truncatula]|uniref:Transmembrane protein, putative n=1 Tax=Medicago truncatula TaxID=3880 RepID=A0A072UBS2_MEDTR|nr:transmembrane protein, putative [Medicago truncatula]RHN52597.1 hypothetical protein MtrunA17_Chr6g0482271 [Medicago truncatula]
MNCSRSLDHSASILSRVLPAKSCSVFSLGTLIIKSSLFAFTSLPFWYNSIFLLQNMSLLFVDTLISASRVLIFSSSILFSSCKQTNLFDKHVSSFSILRNS